MKQSKKSKQKKMTKETASGLTADGLLASRAPLAEHLIELRKRLAICCAAFVLAFVAAFLFAAEIFDLLLLPYERAAGDGQVRLIYTAPQEFFFTQIKVAFFGALVLSFPIIAQQLYRFVAPGLYASERKAFLPFLCLAPLLFLAGAALVYFVIMPLALGFFLSMEAANPLREIEMLPKVSEYLELVMLLMIAFGLCFQLPVVIALLARAGLVSSKGLAKARPYAIVAIFAVAALLTPPDIVSQIGLALPTLLLYEIALWAAYLIERKETKNAEND